MTEPAPTAAPDAKPTWSFPREFWLANFMELCERAAYYGFFIALTLYLTNVVGFSDKETGIVGGVFYAGIYLLPPFTGAVADRIGFRSGLVLAFGLLACGYTLLGLFPHKVAVLFFLAVVMTGGSFIKPLITGTVSKTSSAENRARAFSLFYWVVNIGAFGGKTFVPFIRQGLGLQYVSLFSAAMALVAMLCALLLFHPSQRAGGAPTTAEALAALRGIFTQPRLVALTLIVAGFWTIQSQMYATMPKYVIRLLGPGAKPEWLANVNPLVVVLCVVPVTQLLRKHPAVNSMLVGMALMPLSVLAMATSQAGPAGAVLGMHPLTVMMTLGIAIQGFAECFISPRFLEYFSLQAPRGQEGLYLGFSHLHSFFSALAGFFLSGFLLDAYCPDPAKLPPGLTEAQRAAYYADAHKLWYVFIAIGLAAAVALAVFRAITVRLDRKAAASAG